MTQPGVLWISNNETDQKKQNAVVQQLMQGRTNATGTLTLSSSGATSTTVSAPTCGPNSVIFLSPQSPAAAAALATSHVPSTNISPMQFIVNHSSSTSTSLTFGWIALG